MDEKIDEGDWERGSWALYKKGATLIVVARAQCPYDVGTVLGVSRGARRVQKRRRPGTIYRGVVSRLRREGEGKGEEQN